ncbi:MAG: helix-turn-helix domain-containing protein [Desulfobulbaceae bacterium]
MSEMWLELLRRQVQLRGASMVARELGVSPTTISLTLNGKYGASTDKIERRVMRIYGDGTGVDCPVLGKITPRKCVETWERAGRIGSRAGNPRTIKLYKLCMKCDLRSS